MFWFLKFCFFKSNSYRYTPAYFGTAHGDEVCCCGMWNYPPTSADGCYAQGGGGYGMNAAALRVMAANMRECQRFGVAAGASQLWDDALFGGGGASCIRFTHSSKATAFVSSTLVPSK